MKYMALAGGLWAVGAGVALAFVCGATQLETGVGDRGAGGGTEGMVREVLTKEAAEQKRLIDIFQRYNSGLTGAEAYVIAMSVMECAELYDLTVDLVTSIILVESGAIHDAVSPAGAVGLMQVMPHMAASLGVKEAIHTIPGNIRVGCFLLRDNIDRWGYDEGVARYFWGMSKPDGRYLARVKRVMGEVEADANYQLTMDKG